MNPELFYVFETSILIDLEAHSYNQELLFIHQPDNISGHYFNTCFNGIFIIWI